MPGKAPPVHTRQNSLLRFTVLRFEMIRRSNRHSTGVQHVYVGASSLEAGPCARALSVFRQARQLEGASESLQGASESIFFC